MPKPNKLYLVVGVIIVSGLVLLGGCNLQKPSGSNSNQSAQSDNSIEASLEKQVALQKFDNYDEITNFLSHNISTGDYYGYGRDVMTIDSPTVTKESSPFDTGMAEDTLVAPDAAAGANYSTTNIQVSGVDEGDMIKNDDKYLYSISGNTVYISEIYPAAIAKILGSIKFDSAPQGLYLNGKYLVVYGADYNFGEVRPLSFVPQSRYNFSYLKVYDISTDKTKPVLMRDLKFEGGYYESRQIGDYVYFITNTYAGDELEPQPIPYLLEGDIALNAPEKCGRSCPGVYYFDMIYNSPQFFTISAINVTNAGASIAQEMYLLDNSQTMYVSSNNIYLSYTKRLDDYRVTIEVMRALIFPSLAVTEQNKILAIEATDTYVLNESEKTRKVGAILEKYMRNLSEADNAALGKELEAKLKVRFEKLLPEMEQTVIHKIAINKDEIEYKGKGSVPGQVLNQFSLDEDNGYLRIATTKGQLWNQYLDDKDKESYSNLYVLDKNLKQVGSVEKLATGERIYSVRFLAKRAYIVTFKQVDPLFVLDLSEPTAPKVLGELKIPGFSEYLHPYGDNMLIGIGKETKVEGENRVITGGIKVSLFDVTDVANPIEKAVYTAGGRGSNSLAEYDHKAFLFAPSKNLMVLPVTLYKPQSGDMWSNELEFTGALVFRVDEKSLALRGQLSHADLLKVEVNYPQDEEMIKRSLYIKDMLYSFSPNALKAYDLESLKEINKLKFDIAVPETYYMPLKVDGGTSGSSGSGSTPSAKPLAE